LDIFPSSTGWKDKNGLFPLMVVGEGLGCTVEEERTRPGKICMQGAGKMRIIKRDFEQNIILNCNAASLYA
jgi:hypothetical protein